MPMPDIEESIITIDGDIQEIKPGMSVHEVEVLKEKFIIHLIELMSALKSQELDGYINKKSDVIE